MLKRRMIL